MHGPNSQHDTKSRRIGSLDASAASPQVVSAVERSRIAVLCCSAAVWRRRLAAPPGTHRCPAWRMRRRRDPFSSYRERIGSRPASTRARYARFPHAAGALAVTELVEHEQRVIAHAPKVSVVRRSLLFSMHRTLRTVHVQDHPPVRRVRHRSVHPLSVHSAQPFHVAVLGSTSVSNRLMVLVLAAGLSGPPRRPTITRIVGSSDNRSASLVSS